MKRTTRAKSTAPVAKKPNNTEEPKSAEGQALIDLPLPKIPKIKTTEAKETVEAAKDCKQVLNDLKTAEYRVQAKQLSKAIQSVKETQVQNEKADLIESTKALNKLGQIKTESEKNQDFFEFFAPNQDEQILNELETLADQNQEIYKQAKQEFERNLHRTKEQIDRQTERLTDACSKALKASNFNLRLCSQIQAIISGPTLNTRAGQEKLRLSFAKFQENYSHFDRFVRGIDQTNKFIRKSLDLPIHEEPVPSTSNTVTLD